MNSIVEKQNPRRRERKFLIENVDAFWIRSLIRLHPAGFRTAFENRFINNIYFDTLNFDAFREGVDGLAQRIKTRIRWYGNLEGEVEPCLQKKIRDNLDGLKDEWNLSKISITPDRFWKDALKDFEHDLTPQRRHLLHGLSPTLINRYERSYYVTACGNFRLTIDQHLEYFDQNASSKINTRRRVTSHPYLIVELKYDPVHDTTAHDIASWFPFRMSRSSKYKTGLCSGVPL